MYNRRRPRTGEANDHLTSRANAKNSDMRVPVCDLRLYLIESNVRAFVLSLILIISPIRDTFLVHIHSTAAGWEHSIIMSRTCGYFTMPPIIQSMELYYFSFGKKFYARQRQQHTFIQGCYNFILDLW